MDVEESAFAKKRLESANTAPTNSPSAWLELPLEGGIPSQSSPHSNGRTTRLLSRVASLYSQSEIQRE